MTTIERVIFASNLGDYLATASEIELLNLIKNIAFSYSVGSAITQGDRLNFHDKARMVLHDGLLG